MPAPRTVAECTRMLAEASGRPLARLISELASDERSGVRDAVARARRRLAAERAETRRLDALHALQRRLHAEGCACVAGVDEVGRGALAGPVTAAAVVLSTDVRILGLDDSKRLRREVRERVASEVSDLAVAWAVAHVPAHIIDAIGIAPATRLAMSLALERLPLRPDHVMTDGLPAGLPYPETAVVGGDATVAAIAAASVVAKVARDRLMEELARHYGPWNLEVNRGYGTPEHLAALRISGVSPVHRRSFAPCGVQPTLF